MLENFPPPKLLIHPNSTSEISILPPYAGATMAPSSNAPEQKLFQFKSSVGKRTEAPRCPSSPLPPPPKKYKSLKEIMKTAEHRVLDSDYDDVRCEECGSGDRPDEMLLCDKCDKGFHMCCLRPIVVRVPIGSWFCPSCSGERSVRSFPLKQTKIIDFFRIQICLDTPEKCSSPQDSRKRRRRSVPLVMYKKRRRLLPFNPTEDPERRLEQMSSLANALMTLHMEFSNDLTYMPGMAPKSANQARFEDGGMQVHTNAFSWNFLWLKICKKLCQYFLFPV
uniref:PHD-type domain-containing protein n=1 Tax=Nelumbo nucifera TaxID=4432 RepID=A0A822Z574_NELNU|nr:TPA_asm: hypothetical protein HUJ06_014310 [Nelumbo nucifera]